jgi:hypothetical protein
VPLLLRGGRSEHERRSVRFSLDRSVFAAWLLGGVLLFGGCGQSDDALQKASAEHETITRTAADGPVSVTFSVTPAQVEVDRQAEAVIEVTAPASVTISIEEYPRRLREGDMRFVVDVVGRQESPPVPRTVTRKKSAPQGAPTSQDAKVRPAKELLVWTYRYQLAFYLPGEHELPGVRVTWADVRDPNESDGADTQTSSPPPESRTIETETIVVTVLDPAGEALTEADLYDVTVLDPVELRRPWSEWWWPLGIAALAATLGTWLLARWRSRRGRDAAVYVPPAHEWAWSEIARLIADDLIARGRVQEFYYRVSDIVRGYIERRFDVRAPEMTTEEFLTASASDPRFGRAHRDELARFLTACDLVKYAKHVPDTGEADGLLRAAREFIEQTRERSTVEERDEIASEEIEERAA